MKKEISPEMTVLCLESASYLHLVLENVENYHFNGMIDDEIFNELSSVLNNCLEDISKYISSYSFDEISSDDPDSDLINHVLDLYYRNKINDIKSIHSIAKHYSDEDFFESNLYKFVNIVDQALSKAFNILADKYIGNEPKLYNGPRQSEIHEAFEKAGRILNKIRQEYQNV